jgi:hypothetical protein
MIIFSLSLSCALQVNGKKKGAINVPVEWTSPENHCQLARDSGSE